VNLRSLWFHSRAPLWLLAEAVVLLGAVRCTRPSIWSSGLSEQGRSRITEWLFCDECERGQRDSVAALRDVAVAPLGRVLRQVPEDWRSNLESRYAAAAKRAQLTGSDSTLYVQLHLNNFVATVQSRSAISLGDIKTPAAITILQDAIDDSTGANYRTDVIRVLRNSMVAATTTRLQTNYAPRDPPFLDTVWVPRENNVAWDRDETVTLTGAPFPQDVMVGFRANDTQLGFVAAARPGEYTFAIGNVGAQDSQYFGDVRITSFPAAPTTTVPDLSAGPFPRVFLQSLSGAITPPDKVHYFRFAPAGNLTITASAEWMGSSQIDLIWDNCLNRSGFDKNPGRITGRVQTASGEPLGNVTISLVGTTMGTISTLTGRFEIGPVPLGWNGTLRALRIGLTPATQVAWEGAGDVVVVMALPPGTTPLSQLVRSPSPNASTHLIPAGSCHLLGVLKSDTTTPPAIVRLRITAQ
jgi:hypothetical protein